MVQKINWLIPSCPEHLPGVADQFMGVTLSVSLTLPCQGCLRVPRWGLIQSSPNSDFHWLGSGSGLFHPPLWRGIFHPSAAGRCSFPQCHIPSFFSALQNLPTDMYRFSVLVINDISALPVFTKESNHALTSLCVCSDLHSFAQALAEVPCSEQ